MKIHKGDQVLIISGKYRGKKGKVLKAFPKERKIIVEGINLRKKHRKAQKTGEKGQTVEIPGPLDVSGVKIICPKCKKATRIGYKIVKEKKYRLCKKCSKTI